MKPWEDMKDRERDIAITLLLELPIYHDETLSSNALFTGITASSFRKFSPTRNIGHAMEIELKIMQMDPVVQTDYVNTLQLLIDHHWKNETSVNPVNHSLKLIHADAAHRMQAVYLTLSKLKECSYVSPSEGNRTIARTAH